MVNGGTDVHLVLVDLRNSELDGQQAEDALHRIGITVNRNAVPFDPRPPMVSSGLRIGTPALATRGFGAAEFTEVADIIATALIAAAAGTGHPGRRAPPSNSAPGSPPWPNSSPSTPTFQRRHRHCRLRSRPDWSSPVSADLLPEHPDFLWRNPEPKSSYDAVIVGGGGHGLATAYFLAKNHGMTNIAVLEKGWLAGGNMARNTTIIRSNYLWDESAAIYEHALKLWEILPEELEYDFLFSQRGVMNLAHTLGDVRESMRRVGANKLNGVDAEWLDPKQVKELCPILNISDNIRYPVMGATYQPRAGIAKHDHVAWAFARKCDELGVDIIQNCEVTGFVKDGNRVVGVKTNRGTINTEKVGLCAAGHSSVLAEMAGFRLPIQSHPLQALVSELHEPVHPTVVMSNHVHVYVSQAHKGELVMGAGVDSYNGYGQRGSFHVIEHQMAAAVELFPIFARAHVLRTWGGIVDTTLDASPDRGHHPGGEHVRELRLGHRRLQGHPRCRPHLRPHHRHGHPAQAEQAVCAGTLRNRRPDRRTRRRRRRPLAAAH